MLWSDLHAAYTLMERSPCRMHLDPYSLVSNRLLEKAPVSYGTSICGNYQLVGRRRWHELLARNATSTATPHKSLLQQLTRVYCTRDATSTATPHKSLLQQLTRVYCTRDATSTATPAISRCSHEFQHLFASTTACQDTSRCCRALWC